MIFVDISIIILLIVSVTYCWQLNRKIVSLQNASNDFSFLTENFNNAIKRADQTLANLKELTGETTSHLQSKIEKANFVINDLCFMNDKAISLADKLELIMNQHNDSNEKLDSTKNEENVVKMHNSSKINSSDIIKSLNNKTAIESLLKRMQQTRDEEQDNEGNQPSKFTKNYDQYFDSLKKV